ERAALHLRLHQVARGARDMRTGNRGALSPEPGADVIAARRDAVHEGMPRRMKFDGVDAFALYIETVQDRRVAVGEARMLEIRSRPERRACAYQIGGGGARTFAPDCLLQRPVAAEEIVVHQRRG